MPSIRGVPAVTATMRRRRLGSIPAERRRDLIRGTIASIAKLGYHNSTVQTICDAAGLSRGLIGHYFRGKDDLLLEAFRYLTKQLRQETEKEMNMVGGDPVERILAVVDATFREPVMGRDEAAVWLAFWGVVYWHPGLRKVHLKLWREYRRRMSKLLEAAAKEHGVEIDARLAGWTFSQLADGLWMGWVMDEASVTPGEARDIMRKWVFDTLQMRPRPRGQALAPAAGTRRPASAKARAGR